MIANETTVHIGLIFFSRKHWNSLLRKNYMKYLFKINGENFFSGIFQKLFDSNQNVSNRSYFHLKKKHELSYKILYNHFKMIILSKYFTLDTLEDT